MNKPLRSASLIVIGALAMPIASHAADDRSTDRDQPKVWVKDSVITGKIKAQLLANKMSTIARLHVDTDANGAVQLTGTAKTRADAERAEAIARTVEGVVTVDNRIKVKNDG